MITKERLEKISSSLQMISEDAENDAKNLDGKPFNGQTTAANFGYIYASIHSLAKIINELVEEKINE